MLQKLHIFSALLISSLAIGGYSASLPNDIQLCKLSDPSLTACLTKSAQMFLPYLVEGLPDLGMPSFEPLKIPDISNNDTVLNFKLTNNRLFGSTTSKMEEVKIDQIKKKITLTFVSSGRMDSNYTVNGRLLILPVVGKGESHIGMNDVRYVYKLYYNVVKGKDGKDYWRIVKNKVDFTPTNVSFQLTNLFNGNKQFADTILKFANQNWQEVYGLLGKPSIIIVTEKIVEQMTSFFSKIPVDQLFAP